MTRALAVVFLVGCGGPADTTPERCSGSVACRADLVCTRDALCLPPDQVRAVHITWTVSGASASTTSCAAAPDLQLRLRSPGGLHLEFDPVSCAAGKFTVDRLPTEYDTVELGRELLHDAQRASIDAAGNALLNLPY